MRPFLASVFQLLGTLHFLNESEVCAGLYDTNLPTIYLPAALKKIEEHEHFIIESSVAPVPKSENSSRVVEDNLLSSAATL